MDIVPVSSDGDIKFMFTFDDIGSVVIIHNRHLLR